MSSSISPTKLGLLIPQLMKNIEHSLLECEDKMQIETGNLEEKVYLMQRNEGLAELEKLKVEEKLQRSEKRCDKLKETIDTLIDQTTAKDKLICKLNWKINQLKTKNLENERCVGVYQEKLKRLLMKMSEEIEDLTPDKSSANRKMQGLSGKQFDADQHVKATPIIHELRHKKLGSDSFEKASLKAKALGTHQRPLSCSCKKNAKSKQKSIRDAIRAVRNKEKWCNPYKSSFLANMNFLNKFTLRQVRPPCKYDVDSVSKKLKKRRYEELY